jgi:cell division protease FtsH
MNPLGKSELISYSEVKQKLDAGEIKALEIDFRKGSGLAIPKNGTKPEERLTFIIPQDTQLGDKLAKDYPGVDVRFKNSTSSEYFAQIVLPLIMFVLLFGGLWYFLGRQMQSSGSQALSFGRSRARRFGEQMSQVTFSDVAGVDEAKEELQEVVEFLRDPARFRSLGAKIPKGVLLLGPPGCGKTLLARAVAGEAKVPFFFISGSDFVEMFVGVGASRVRDLFSEAKGTRPCIVFIDEIDAVGRHRGAGLGGGHDEREQTLNQLLVEMDGFDPNEQIIIIAATNRPDILDPALLRAGRFDRRIIVDQTDMNGRKEIFRIYLKGKPVSPEVAPEILARRTPGFSGADIENVVNEAALLAARLNKKVIEPSDIESAIDKVLAGPERKSRIINEEEKRIIAYHEAGHALVSKSLPNADPVHKVSILSRGMALGYTMQVPTEDRYLRTKSQLFDQVTSLLGGRAAEELVFGEPTTGASNDLENVTLLAREMVTQFGMSETLGPLTFGRKHGPVFLGKDLVEEKNYSDDVARAIDEEIKKLIDHCYAEAQSILSEKRTLLDKIVERLLEIETMDSEELGELIRNGTSPQASPPAEPAASISPSSQTPR